MIITAPSRQKSRLGSVTQAAMPFARALARFVVFYCVLVAARETFYPNLPRHSPELTLWRFGMVPVAWAILRAAEWRKETTK